MENKKACGYDFKPFTEEENQHIMKYYTKYDKKINNNVRVGPAGYVLEGHFLTHADGIRNLQLRPDDVFVVSYPRSGTTWVQELVWLINNDLDFERAKSSSLANRFQFLEFYMFFAPQSYDEFVKNETSKHIWEECAIPDAEVLKTATTRRFVKTHLPLSLLPAATLDTTKVVYVTRDMRDVAVSCYHFYKALPWYGIECDFKEFYLNVFSKDMSLWSPYFEHIKEHWALRRDPNMLFLLYEDLSKDLKSSARRVADFFGKNYSDQQLEKLCSHLAFDNFKVNTAVNADDMVKGGNLSDGDFIRRGKSGGWRDYFDAEMSQHATRWMEEKLGGTGIQFNTYE